jgi:hypothetical protein
MSVRKANDDIAGKKGTEYARNGATGSLGSSRYTSEPKFRTSKTPRQVQ